MNEADKIILEDIDDESIECKRENAMISSAQDDRTIDQNND